ncbi:hypothetical protein DFH08DRAFT_1077690 [Mycena albidolilacea]|uniref:Uncharacterized protein n=1 Tax=Mycena albidolilacea TaxID=1033008 RepID=A0AAD7AAQ6_9AGAR|nr:hypothetical protein DFH08DRAFT_1077690 [Mycena albidolilacea]
MPKRLAAPACHRLTRKRPPRAGAHSSMRRAAGIRGVWVRGGGGVFCRWVWGAVCERQIYALGTSANGHAASSSKPYELVERAREWDVVPEGVVYGVKRSRMEGDGEVDVVSGGIAADDPTCKDRVRGKTRRLQARGRAGVGCAHPRRGRGGRRMSPLRREWARIMARSTQRLCSPPPRLFLTPPHALAPHSRHRRPLESFQVPRLARALYSSATCHRAPALAARVRLGFPLARVRVWRYTSPADAVAGTSPSPELETVPPVEVMCRRASTSSSPS